MKYIYSFFLIVTLHFFAPNTVVCCEKNNAFLLATQKFKTMKVAEIRNMDIFSLSAEQLRAFKALAREIFSQEIASAGCFSQANRRKYEVMYQKIGQADAHCKTS